MSKQVSQKHPTRHDCSSHNVAHGSSQQNNTQSDIAHVHPSPFSSERLLRSLRTAEPVTPDQLAGQSLPWAQQPQETDEQYALAEQYFSYGPKKRSLKRVMREMGASERVVSGCSRRFAWVERARAYDRYCEQTWYEQQEEVIVRTARHDAQKWIDRMREKHEAEWEFSHLLMQRAQEMLATPIEDGKWKPSDVTAYSELAGRLARQVASEASVLSQGETPSQDSEARCNAQSVRVEYVDSPHVSRDTSASSSASSSA